MTQPTPDPAAPEPTGNEIAIIGMAARFPGAPDLAAFWRNLRAGVESISFFAADELETSRLVTADARWHPDFVPAGGVLPGADRFDHDLFGIAPRQARWMDPQQRVFLETVWAALEDAGHDPRRFGGRVSVYAGAGISEHLLELAGIATDPASLYEAMGSATSDNLASRVAFEFGLRGESVTVHTACSTGLAAVHMACQSLLLGQSAMAVAGAVRLAARQRTGYVHADGMILSPDGHCRAFDHRAGGTVGSNGVGVVVLKPLADALAGGDQVYAVIEGSAVNNDGQRGVGYTAPSVAGQAEVVTEALAFAGVSGGEIGYLEAHGTGTRLGDPIEIAALTRAYRRSTDRVGDLPIGSVKSNIGHLDTAAGIAGLIKVALMLRHRELPPSLHFERPNPDIAFDGSPFVVNTELQPWPAGPARRRLAGVSSFGIGGTNVHAVVGEAPAAAGVGPSSRPNQVVTLAAHTSSALATMTAALAEHLAGQVVAGRTAALADVAYTRAVGRAPLRYRRSYVAGDVPELVAALRKPAPDPAPAAAGAKVAFLFPGQGAAWHGVAAELHRTEPAFRASLERCLAELEPRLGQPLAPVLLAGEGPIDDPELAHAALFAVEYALAALWMGWGVRPAALLGHSFGEYVAACLAGVLPLADAAALAVARGRLVAKLPDGGMLAVGLDEPALLPYLTSQHGSGSAPDANGASGANGLTGDELALAAVNGDGRCVVSGSAEQLAALRTALAGDGHSSVPLPVRHAFHSPAVEPVLAELEAAAAACRIGSPSVPLVSSVTGTWWDPDPDGSADGQPAYWARQMRRPVRFGAGLETLAATGSAGEPLLLVEVGADQALTALARAQLRGRATALPSLRRQQGSGTDCRVLMTAVGKLWAAGVPVDWDAFYREESRRRISLPGYPFEGTDCRLEPAVAPIPVPAPPASGEVDRAPAALSPAAGPAVPTVTNDGPRDDIERQVFDIWAERLGTADFGIHDNFLELGGNSLMAAQMLARLRDGFAVPIPLSVLFEAPTVAGVAEQVRALLGGTSAASAAVDDLPAIEPVGRDGDLRLSVVQERTLTLDAADPGNPAMTMPLAVRIDGRLDLDALRHAVGEVTDRHETLRTTFHRAAAGHWTPRIEPAAAVAVEVEPLTGTGAEREALAEQQARAEPMTGFDLTVSPLRVRVLRIADDRHVLLVTLHHVVSDTWSMANLMAEISASYRARVTGQPSQLAPLPVQYADYAAWQRRSLETGALDRQRDYWLDRMAALPGRLALPTDQPRDTERGVRGGRLDGTLPAGLSSGAGELSRRFGVTGFITLLAAYGALLSRLTGSDDVVVGTPIGNRDRSGLQPVIGYVAHAIPLRIDLAGDPTFADLVARTRQTLTSAYANADLPYEQLVATADPVRAGGRMFDALFVLHTGLPSAQELPGSTWRLWEVPDMPAMFGPTMSAFTLGLAETPAGLAGGVEYATELFGRATARRIFDQFGTVLADAVANPLSRVSELNVDPSAPPRQVRPAPVSGSASARVLDREPSPVDRPGSGRGLTFSLSYFANDEDALEGPKYRLLLDGARIADQRGLAAVWTPERHFHSFGGLYPSPTAINAGLATVTSRIGLRAGSVVLPLHDPIRVAEEWSVIDNLSGGRVGVSFASGWNADDFVFAPDRYADRRRIMADGIDLVRRLWRGEPVRRVGGTGDEVEIRIRPRPVQPELPFWLTGAGSLQTFRLAGELGGFVLTNLMGKTLDGLAEQLAAYREAWRAAGHPGGGHVTLMLHTFLADDADRSYTLVRQPLLDYFRSSVDVGKSFMAAQGLGVRFEDLTEADVQALLEHGVARYVSDGGLFGTPASCAPIVDRVRELGVDEVAALIDFGTPVEDTLRSVELLADLADAERADAEQTATDRPEVVHLSGSGALEAPLSHSSAITPVRRDRPLPLSYAQQRLWYLDQLVGQNIAYNNAVALRMRGPVDPAALRGALNQVVARHEVLHTTFPMRDDGPVQVIGEPFEVDLPVVDVPADGVQATAREFARQPFDLATAPLLRACLLRQQAAPGGTPAPDEHVLLLSMHHIVSDGWSAGVLLTELATKYVAGVTGIDAPLPELPVQYADYAVWQRAQQDSPAIAAELDYWRETLADVPMLELPVDRPRGPVQSNAGARHPVRIDRELAGAINRLCREARVTPYMVLHAALVTLLHRYSGQTDLALGTAVAGRNRPEVEQLVGCFINTVVVRTDLAGDPTFGTLLDRVREATLGAISHQETPFERLVDELNVPRALSHSPLFQAMVVLHNTPNPKVELGELTLEGVEIDSGTAKLDLTLELREGTEGITGSWEYNTALFEPDTMEQLTGHLLRLLTSAVAARDTRLSELAMTSAEQRERVLALSVGAPLPLPAAFEAGDGPGPSVAEVFQAQVARTPDAIAIGAADPVSAAEPALTYRELDERANAIAHGLRARGVRPGDRVALLVDAPTEAVVGMFAVLKSGAGYLPIDAHAPASRIEGLLAQAEPVAILAGSASRPEAGRAITSYAEIAGGQPAEPPAPAATGADLAYLIFTSGSTGVPKGVPIMHHQLLRSTWARCEHYGDAGRCLNLYALSFDGAVGWLYFALLTGGSLWCPPAEAVADPLRLAELVAANQVERMAGVPALYGQLLAAASPQRLGSLRSVTVGGEACLPGLVRAHFDALPETELHNEYGPTEATVWSTAHRVRPPVHGRVPIGRPVAGARNYVLDQHRQLLPVGAAGELYIGGPIVAGGYFGDPELTGERFGPDPFAADGSGSSGSSDGCARLYRTGDRVRWNQHGVLEFLGRVDRQVKVRGFRVDPAEAEAALAAHPSVAEVAVVAVPTAPPAGRTATTTQLIGYLTPVAGAELDAAELRAFAQARLPEYLVPAVLVPLPALPRNRHGKLDVRALPAPDLAVRTEPVAPRTDLERTMAEVAGEVLGRPPVGVEDNFFDLGGDSILAISLVTRARRRGVELTVRQLFQNPTVAGLATVAGTRLAVRAEQGAVAGPVPLTPVQRWFFDQGLAQPWHWNSAAQVELAEPVDAELLAGACRAVLAHHDALRLRFVRDGDRWRQHNAPAEPGWTLDQVDLSGLPAAEQDAALDAAGQRLQASLDLAGGPMFRVALVRRGPDRPDRLLLVAHHLVADGVSWRIIMADLFAAYRALAAERPADAELPPKTTSYAEWAVRLPEFAAGPQGRAEVDFWVGQPYHLAPRLPRDGDVPNVSAATRLLRVELDQADTAAVLSDLPRRHRVEVHELLVAAAAQALAGWTGSEHVQLDIERHGREDLVPDIDVVRTVGWFSDFHPVVLPVPADAGPAERLAAVAERLRSVPHHGAGYVPLRYGSLTEREVPAVAALRAVEQSEFTINYLGQLDVAVSAAEPVTVIGELAGQLRADDTPRPWLIELTAGVLGGRLWLVWAYAGGIHHEATIERLAAGTVSALRELMAHS